MARIAGVDIPREKRIEVALQYIFGVGPAVAKLILERTGVDPDARTKDLSEADVSKLREEIDRNHQVEGDLRRVISLNIKRLIEVGSFRGIRHRKGLPVRGQRTKTNARTRRGVKKTVAGKKK
ncbi:MAG: 30S ribosomal protein S13 [Candidatus Sericytochromatia bacterium]|nr:30S ribosomal protein S13 [Candidatus Sericytochromatia bacterium]